MSVARPQLQVIATAPDLSVTRLHQLVRQREALRPTFRDVFERIVALDPDEVEPWAAASLELAHVNAGPACLITFWRVSLSLGPRLGLRALASSGRSAADVCRQAGSQAARGALEALEGAARHLDPGELPLWWGGLLRLAQAAPESVTAVTSRTETILAGRDGRAFDSFIAAGLKATGSNRGRRRAFFSLEDPLALAMLDSLAGHGAFSRHERALKAFAAALFGPGLILRLADSAALGGVPRRTSLIGPVLRVPEVFKGVPAEQVGPLYRAAIAHAGAHRAFGGARFPVGQLKPLQLALVGLVEDARVEALAMRRFPGLFRLWAPFHLAAASGAETAPALLARLARALFDPAYEDGNGFVQKGRALFAAEAGNVADPGISRRIGGLLGNDLGQLRVQFNAKTYVVEPLYRDDGLGLWDFGEQPDATSDHVEVPVDAVRPEKQERPDGEPQESDPDGQRPSMGRARPVAPDDRGTVVATYPEWDRAAGVERPDWTKVREVAPVLGDSGVLDRATDAEPALRGRIQNLVRAARVGRPQRLKRQPEGPELDMDAALEAAIALRTGEDPTTAVYRTSGRRARDLAVMVLIDVSESTRDRVPAASGSVLDCEKLAVAMLAEGLEKLRDPFALRAFASAGREEVRLTRVKDFGEAFDRAARARLAGLSSGLSTRLGAALRHAGQELSAIRSERKLLLVLTDGEPSDIDVEDPRDLVEDARRAVLALKSHGIDTYGVTLDPAGVGSGEAVFGRGHHMPVRRLADLPARLAALYFRLARR